MAVVYQDGRGGLSEGDHGYPLLTDEQIANARLIAAAPAMAEALQKLILAGRAYMAYHAEKFYDGRMPHPVGITPALDEASATLRAAGVEP